MTPDPVRTVELSTRDRELIHCASLDPDTTKILARHVTLETAVGTVAGVCVGLTGGILVAIQTANGWWIFVPLLVGAGLSVGSWARAKQWVTKVRRSLISPIRASTWSATFYHEPSRLYQYRPGSPCVYLESSKPRYRAQRVPLMTGQRPPIIRQQPVMVTVITASRIWPQPTLIIAGDTLLLASPSSVTSRLRYLQRATRQRPQPLPQTNPSRPLR